VTEQPSSAASARTPAEVPTPDLASQPSQGQAPSTPQVIDAEAIAASVRDSLKSDIKELSELVKRVQSDKDRRITGIQRSVADLARRLGVPEEKVVQAQRDQVLDEMVEERLSSPAAPGRAPGEQASPDKGFKDETALLLTKLEAQHGVQIANDELEAMIAEREKSGRPYRSTADYYSDISDLALKKVKQGGVTSAAAVGEAGGKAPAAETDDEIAEKLEKAFRQPTANAGELKRLKEEAKKRGLLK
jgi:hypothetical protein